MTDGLLPRAEAAWSVHCDRRTHVRHRDHRRPVHPDRTIRGGGPAHGRRIQKILPLEEKLIHVRWSGESTWVPLGDLEIGVPFENATSYPRPGEILLYRVESARQKS